MRIPLFRRFAPLVGTMLVLTATFTLLDLACSRTDGAQPFVNVGCERPVA